MAGQHSNGQRPQLDVAEEALRVAKGVGQRAKSVKRLALYEQVIVGVESDEFDDPQSVHPAPKGC
jgi:hypothetical protein